MSRGKPDTDPQRHPRQKNIDDLALEAHSLIEMLRRKRLGEKLLLAAVDALRLIGSYKSQPPRRRGEEEYSPLDLLRGLDN